MKNIAIASLFFITPSISLAFDLPFMKSKAPYQKLYDEMNKVGFSVYGSFTGVHEKYKGDGQVDDSLPVGFKVYNLNPKLKNESGLAGASIRLETAGSVISKVSVLYYNFLATGGLKCDREGLSQFLGIKPTEVAYKDVEFLGPTLMAGLYDKVNGISVNANCQTKVGSPTITFTEPMSNTETKLPGKICSLDTCPLPWAPLIMVKKFYLLFTDETLGGRTSQQAITEAREYLQNKYIPGYLKFLDEAIARNTNGTPDIQNLKKLFLEYKNIAIDKDFVNQIIDRLRSDLKK